MIGTMITGSTLSTSYSTGGATAGNNVGGLVGNNQGTISLCHWDTQTSGTNTGIGSGTISGASGQTTNQMRQQSTFASWDFPAIWTINEGVDYPRHAWE